MGEKINTTISAMMFETANDGIIFDVEIYEGFNDDMPEVVGEQELRDLVKIDSKLVAVSKRIKNYAYGGESGKWYRGSIAEYKDETADEVDESKREACYIWLSDKAAEHVKDMLPA